MIYLTNELGASLTLPLTMAWTKVPLGINVPVTKLSRGGGVVSGNQALQPRAFTLEGSLFYGDVDLNHAAYDEIKQFLQHTPIEVSRYDDREIVAYPTKFDMNGMDMDIELQVKIDFIAPDPLFYGTAVSHEEDSLSGSTTFTAPNDGTYNAKPLIHLMVTSGSFTGLTISANGFIIEIDGVFEADDEILIDCSKFTVEAKELYGSYVSIITLAGDDFLVYGFELIPEENSVTINATGTYTLDITMDYRHTWL